MTPTYLTFQQLPLLAYGMNYQEITESTSCTIDPFCNSWTIINLGDIWVTVNGMLLKGYPPGHPELTGASTGQNGNFGEVFKGNISVQSAVTTAGSGTTQFLVLFMQKIYNLS